MLIPRSEIRSALRRLWFFSHKPRREALKRAKSSLGFYLCETCRCPTKKPEVDHRMPVGATPGARDAPADATWDGLITRLFCAADGLEVLCRDCHAQRTAVQRKGGAA